jgi:hypothetical protein
MNDPVSEGLRSAEVEHDGIVARAPEETRQGFASTPPRFPLLEITISRTALGQSFFSHSGVAGASSMGGGVFGCHAEAGERKNAA